MKLSLERLHRLENSYRVTYLIREYLKKNMSIEEEEELDKWILASDDNMELFEVLTNEENIDDFLKWFSSRDVERNLIEVKKRLRFRGSTRITSFWKYAAAACLVGLIGFSIYYFPKGSSRTVNKTFVTAKIDILPGSKFAILKLGNGETVSLKAITDTIINDDVKVVNGELVYASVLRDEQQINELIIPRKGFYKLILPDGTKVWLNSQSSIRYPTRFDSSGRHVFVTGETYFDVAHDPSKPFIVSVNGIEVQALGTEFNINAYEDEAELKATLIRGSVRVSGQGNEKILRPGEQLKIHSENWVVADVETQSVAAWKDNKFKFKDASIDEIMRQVQRWYDVKIEYADKINFHFNGTIDRSVPVSHLLQLLEETGNVNFEIKENEIVVKK